MTAPILPTLTLTAAREAARARGVPLSELFLLLEVERSDLSRDALRDLMRARLEVMRQAVRRGLETPQHSRSGLIRGAAHRMKDWLEGSHSLLAPRFSRLVAAALAVSEGNACMGRIVAAPTAGSCGVIPAVLFVVGEELGASEEAQVAALFTAGGIGLVIERLATLSGAEGGCQAEVGAASAMAAGAAVELAGGAPEQVEHAVALALANVLGLVCDPVDGLVEVPCVYRNVMGAANAVACAEMALAGIPSLFSADAVIEAMGRVGRRIPEELRETSRGGLAAIPRPRGT